MRSVAREMVTYFASSLQFKWLPFRRAAVIVLVSKCLLLYNKEIICRYLRLSVVESCT